MSNFKLTNLMTSAEIEMQIGTFAGGEVKVRILPEKYVVFTEVRIDAMLYNSNDVMTLIMIVDALRNLNAEKIRLTMPYIPYARQDRICNPGEAFSIKAFARIINSLDFSSVVVYDAHSDVSTALIDRCINVPRHTLMAKCDPLRDLMATSPSLYLVSPDAGAVKKSLDTVKIFGEEVFDGIIFAEKVRDPMTGAITKTTVNVSGNDEGPLIEGADLLIADDICDGGRTFIELAKVLRLYAPKSISLYVTHGIFSYGKDILFEQFDNVWSETEFGYKLDESTGKYIR